MSEKISQTVNYEYSSPQGTLFCKDNVHYAVTGNEENVVPVPKSSALFMSLALRAQAKVITGNYPNLSKLLSLMNCRKTIFVAEQKMSLSDAVKSEEDINGVRILLDEIDSVQNGDHETAVFYQNFNDVRSVLDKYTGSFPCFVHLFEIEKDYAQETGILDLITSDQKIPKELLEKMHRTHSFSVLGEDESEYVCFQKMGPLLQHPFEIVTLEEVLQSIHLSPTRVGIAFIGIS